MSTKPIPIAAAKRVAEEFGYDQVVILARKIGVTEHVTSYGVDKPHCDVAARMAYTLKYRIMGWPERTATESEKRPGLPSAVGVYACAENANGLTIVFRRRPTPSDLKLLQELVGIHADAGSHHR